MFTAETDTIPTSSPIELEIWPSAHWGHSYIAGFATEQQAIDFFDRKASSCAIHEHEAAPIDQRYTALLDRMYPTCEHGLSASNCYGPGHYAPDGMI